MEIYKLCAKVIFRQIGIGVKPQNNSPLNEPSCAVLWSILNRDFNAFQGLLVYMLKNTPQNMFASNTVFGQLLADDFVG